MLALYDYERSSAAYRVRIALAIKGIAVEHRRVDLRAGAQHAGPFADVNPQALVPALVIEDGDVLTQSLAIIEYLDEVHPQPPLLPRTPAARAKARALALAIAAEIHPIQNLRVLERLRDALKQPEEEIARWARHWIETGLGAFQAMLAPYRGRYCMGDAVTLPDLLLAPQMVNARRFGCDLAPLGRLTEIDAALRALPAFRDTAPPPQTA